MKVRYLASARQEVDEALANDAAIDTMLAQDLVRREQAAREAIGRSPWAFAAVSPRVRRHVLRRFHYSLIYALRGDGDRGFRSSPLPARLLARSVRGPPMTGPASLIIDSPYESPARHSNCETAESVFSTA